MLGLFKRTEKIDIQAFHSDLLMLCKDVVVPEFDGNVVDLDFLKESEWHNEKVVLNLVLPTFALLSEKEIAIAVKRHAMSLVPTEIQVELNVFADVKPATSQSLSVPGLADVKNIILVASGKGGVGKSTVASNLAMMLSQMGCRTGLLDADVYGPSIPTMFGVAADTPVQAVEGPTPDKSFMLPIERFGLKLMSIGFLVDTSSAMVWRGPMIASASMQMFYQVAWGDLDYLVVDMPPGTGDIQLTIAQRVTVAGSVIVSTPQVVALADVVRAKSMFDRVNIPILGIVENMSYFVCDGCDKRHEIFTHGGAQKAALDLGLPFLGEIPFENQVRQGGDEGKPAILNHHNSAAEAGFRELAISVATQLAKQARKNSTLTTLPQIEISGLSAPAKKGLPVIQ